MRVITAKFGGTAFPTGTFIMGGVKWSARTSGRLGGVGVTDATSQPRPGPDSTRAWGAFGQGACEIAVMPHFIRRTCGAIEGQLYAWLSFVRPKTAELTFLVRILIRIYLSKLHHSIKWISI